MLTLLSTKNIEKTVESDLDYTMRGILKYVGINPSFSTQDCHKYLNNICMKVSYENVEIQINNLIKLGLVQKVTNIGKKNKNLIEENEIDREKPKNSKWLQGSGWLTLWEFYKVKQCKTDLEIHLYKNQIHLQYNK